MPLVLTLKETSSIPLEVDSIRMETVRNQSVDEVKRTLIQRGNQQLPIGDFFDVSGSAADDSEIIWEGDCSRVKLIGEKLATGRIRVNGNAGMHLGAEMTGGEIIVNGNVGDWLGAELHGGRIHVHGNAGHLVGAAYRGGRRGMTGGEILIDGNAGNEIGHTMRRGLIAVAGDIGDAAGFNMIAGTILLFGKSGIRHGAGMRRGTIGFLGSAPAPEMLPTFRLSSPVRSLFLNLYFQELRACNFPLNGCSDDAELLRYNGDFLETGLGEIFVRPQGAA